jgi:nitrite reductase (NADH) large subunit
MGVAVGSFGDPFVEGEHIRNLIVQNEAKGIYKKLVIDSQENILLGGILVGDCSEYGQLLQRTQMQSILPTELEELIVKVSGSNDMEHPIDAMPGEALVCSCESVSKQTLLDAFDQGSHCVDSLKKYTKAGTGCGGCVPMLTDIVNRQKEKVGEVVRKVLCEHFDYTRQELVEKIRSNPLHQFSDLLKELGTGQGCEICKPAIASILASYRNEHVMKHQNIQETNDFYMANIQKDGTYSIVPRIAAGEVTAAQLIAIGEVARDFNLYSKITGGQRIDLFGARIENLPKIWKKLIDVGLESGHAYAKSLRTVKSCVGSTWCRFGVQDSTSLAITIENRYKGLRSPHKLIIATEKGYNLYVCGNGGMKPRVADLFAENLTEEDLIQYLDRFLMYYVRTADRLMRTSTWLDSMEGGLERLKQVIIEDSLGICEELESEMQHVVDTYQCEWKTTINDPKSLKKFRSFINLDETDTSIGCEEEQGQKKQLAF